MLSNLEWTNNYTADEAEQDLGNGFEFRGCGWYIEKTGETLLITPLDSGDPWNQDREPLRHYMYFSENPAPWFNAIVNAPTRQDERE